MTGWIVAAILGLLTGVLASVHAIICGRPPYPILWNDWLWPLWFGRWCWRKVSRLIGNDVER